MATVSVTNISFRPQFNVILMLGNVVVIDPTTFPLNGISAADSRFYFKITDFNGDTVYQNPAFDSVPDYTDPDLNGSALTTWLNDLIPLPVNSNNTVVTGLYTATVLQRDNTQAVTDLFTREITKTYDYVAPAQTINETIDIFQPLLTLTDNTNYAVIDPQDNSSLLPLNFSWNWQLIYPQNIGTITSTSQFLQTAVFYEGIQQWSFSAGTELSGLRYDYKTSASDCFFRVLDYITSTGWFEVPVSNLCDLYCCLKSVTDRYLQARAGNQSVAVLQSLRNDMNDCMSIKLLINEAVVCGSYDEVEQYIEDIKAIAKCSDDCSCGEDGFPRQITGIGNPTITQKIEEIADGATTVFPTATNDKNKLKNKSFTDNNMAIFDETDMIPGFASGGGALATFSASTGEFTLNYTPSAGSRITIPIYK